MKRFCLVVLCGLLFTFSSVAKAEDYQEMTIRVATANPIGSLHAAGLEKFKEVLEKESGGKFKVLTSYGGATGDEQSNVRQLRSKILHGTVVACGNLTPFSPRASLFILPYLFPTVESAHKLLSNEAFMQKQDDVIAKESGVRPLAWFVSGYRMITNSKKPIESMIDMQGLKLRVPPVDVSLETYRSWGVEPHPLSWIETFQGLQQGLIDGQDNSYLVIRDQQFWEVQKYITKLHYNFFVAPLLIAETWYQSLNPKTKALIDKAGIEAQKFEWQWSKNEQEKALQALVDKGMVVNGLKDEHVWEEKAKGIWPEFIEGIGGQAVLDEALGIIKN